VGGRALRWSRRRLYVNPTTSFAHALLFTGHMVDLPSRPRPRFPPGMVPAAAGAIAAAMNLQLEPFDPTTVIAISSLARGGDILFQEHARSRNLSPHVVLPFKPEVFVEESVCGVETGDWEERFWRLWKGTLPEHREILTVAKDDNPYEACNKRLLELARQLSERVTLIALSDGTADGAGGTQDLIHHTREVGGHAEVIDVKKLRA
jgi:hypothetical protein